MSNKRKMDLDIAGQNIELFKSVKGKRFYVDQKTQKLCVDDRWFQGIRRTYWGDSRTDVLSIMQKSLKKLAWKKLYEIIAFYRNLVVNWYTELYGESDEIKEFEQELTCPVDFSASDYAKIHQHRLVIPSFNRVDYCIADYLNQPFEKPSYKFDLTKEEAQQYLENEPGLLKLWKDLTPEEQIKSAQDHWRNCGVHNPTRGYKEHLHRDQNDLPKITDQEAIELVEKTKSLDYFVQTNEFTENKVMLAHIGRMWLRKWGPRVLRVLK